jgi:dTDP-4-dehydrorhamnose 3,5-epimerase
VRFIETKLSGAFVIEPERKVDERGFFARAFCQEEFCSRGLETQFVQCSISFNTKRGTLRGMHYQEDPHAETKVVRCTMGAIYDVIIDVRRGSPTYQAWIAVELSAKNRTMLYIPKGFAHGFQTLEVDTEIFYQISDFYHPECARGLRWNDPAFGVIWPIADVTMSGRDRNYPDFSVEVLK